MHRHSFLPSYLSLSLAALSHLNPTNALPKSTALLQKRQTVYDTNIVEIDTEAASHNRDFFTFLTRPDIDAPRWDVKIYEPSAVSPGYWFMGPYQSAAQGKRGGGWVGPHIYDGNGELVWSGVPLLKGFNGFDFHVTNIGGEDMLTMTYWHKYGVIVDSNYTIRQEVHHENGGFNQHDFQIVDNGTRALVMTTRGKRASTQVSKRVGFDGRCRAVWDGFEEYDLATGQRLKEWTAYGHIGLDESFYHTDRSMDQNCNHGAWDFMHGNSIDKFPDGDYLMSARHANTIYKISGKDGSIVWRLGGHKSDFDMNFSFSGQHHTRVQSQNRTHTIVSVMDNAISDNVPETTNAYSRGLLMALRTDKSPMTAEIIARYDHPRGDYAHGRGSFQLLPSGNAFLGWTQYSYYSEHKANGDLIMEATMKPELKSYRSYKCRWVGHPTAPPDVYSVANTGRDGSTTTAVYVSWNGATEVVAWNVYKATPDSETTELIASSPGRGFETGMAYQGYAEYVVVEALDRKGTVLGQSLVRKTVSTSTPTISPEVAQEDSWLQEQWSAHAPSIVDQPLYAFVGGFTVCALAGLLGAAIWRCTSRPKAESKSWWRSGHRYERVSDETTEVDFDADDTLAVDEDEDDDDDGKRARVIVREA